MNSPVSPRAGLAAVLAVVLAVALAGLALTWPAATAYAALAQEDYPSWGHTRAADQRFHEDCHGYKYRWRVKPPTSDWNLETFLRSPDGKRLAADLFHSQSDGNRGRARFKVCGASTRPGKHVIRAKVIYRDGFDEHVVKLRPTRFRLFRG